MRNPSLRLVLAASTALCWSMPAVAQSTSDTAGDIIVTARRVEERLQDVPISITVYNEQQLSNRNIVNGQDLATYTPSLSTNARFGAETATFAIRGFAQENFTSPSVGVYFADVIGPRANGGTLGGNGAGVGQFFDLQNVQVLKGPQGTLFGRNTTGGAVLIVPQRPKDDLGGYIEGSYGNYDMYRIQGVLNLPLSDTFKVRLGFERMKRDGYVRNRSGLGVKGFDDVDYWAVRGSILAQLTPDLENYTIARYSNSHTNGTFAKIVDANVPGCDGGVPRPAAGALANPPSSYGYPGSPQFTLPGASGTGNGTYLSPFTIAGYPSYLGPPACANIQRQRAQGYGFWDVDAGITNPFLKIKQWGVINTTTWRASDTVTFKNIASYQEFRQDQSFSVGHDYLFFPANPQPRLDRLAIRLGEHLSQSGAPQRRAIDLHRGVPGARSEQGRQAQLCFGRLLRARRSAKPAARHLFGHQLCQRGARAGVHRTAAWLAAAVPGDAELRQRRTTAVYADQYTWLTADSLLDPELTDQLQV